MSTSDKPCLVFLHGLFGCKEDWQKVISYLQTEYECIALDLPGHGTAAYHPDIPSYLHTQLNPLQPFVLIGYSMGGRLALRIKELSLHSILISANPFALSEEEKPLRKEWEKRWKHKLKMLPLFTFFKEWYDQSLFCTLEPHLKEQLIEKRSSANRSHLLRTFSQVSLLNQSNSDLSHTSFIYGEKDRKYAQLYRRFALNALAIAHPIEGASHACHLEKPQLVAKTIHTLIERHHAHT